MAEYPDRFQSEVMRLLSTLVKKVDPHDKRFDSLERKVDENTRELKTISGQLNEVAGVVIQHEKRIKAVEDKVEDLQSDIH